MSYIKLDKNQIESMLISNYWRVSVEDEVTSTQDLLLASKATPGTVLATEYQSKGRGRLDRTFESEKGSAILFSLSFQPVNNNAQVLDRDRWGVFPLIAATAVVKTLNHFAADAEVLFLSKWPNDIICKSNNKKIAGILTQAQNNLIYMGIGINVNTIKENLPVEHATSFFVETGCELDRNVIISKILNELEENFKAFFNGLDFRKEYLEHSSTINKEVKAIMPGGAEITGRAIDISQSGALLLQEGQEIHVGDIVHLR